MTVAVMKSKAEQALSTELAARVPALKGNAAAGRARANAVAQFEASGLPHRRIEEWKYSDLRVLVKELTTPAAPVSAEAAQAARARTGAINAATFVFANGTLVARPGALPAGIKVQPFADALASDGALLSLDLPSIVDDGAKSVIALNTALAEAGAVIDIGAEDNGELPIHLVFVSSGTQASRVLVRLAPGAVAHVIETHVSADGAVRQGNALTHVVLGANATLTHIVDVETGAGDVALGNTLVDAAAGATYKPFQFTLGTGVVRQQLFLTFTGQHAAIDFGAVSLMRATGHADCTLVVDHAVPHCTSRELFKCVLADRARGIFQGKVIVRPDAQKTDGKQMAQALMLSPDAEFDSKPELEIYADDVVCGHGTTSAELDEDLLFYCKSRGIPEVEARALLIESFVGEAMAKIEDETLRGLYGARASAWLKA